MNQGGNEARARPVRSGRRSQEVLAHWNPSASEDQLRALYQSRLALFTKAIMAVFVVLMVLINTMYAAAPETRPANAHLVNYMAIPSILAVTALWLRMRRGQASLDLLFWLDFSELLLVGAILGASAAASADKPANLYSCLFYFTFVLFTRCAVVPSSGRRTFWLSSIAFSPMIAAAVYIGLFAPGDIGLPPLYFVIGAIVYGIVAVLLATLGSRVIYGLRKQLKEIEQLGQYSLLEKIGEGGMGSVYRARHAMLRRPTALKLLPMDRVGEDAIRRFEREVQITSELTHPNTVVIYDYGRSPDGVFYYAMEFIDGIDLEQLVRRDGAQKPERVIHLLRQVCGALDEAHRRGLVHRDIKPANVIVGCRGDVADFVKVLDFGLVVDLENETGLSTEAIAGTPAYMCPEAITDPSKVGPASDLYGVGCLAYFLLSGAPVFQGKNGVELCVHHARTEPVPIAVKAVHAPPPELAASIMQCLAKDPQDRPESARALEQTLAQLADTCRWTGSQATDWWRRLASAPPPDLAQRVEHAATVQAPGTMTADLSRLWRPTTD